MITGFNTDIEYEGVVYHVQTEDKGLDSPIILSLVYSGGAILASKRSPYQDLIQSGYSDEALAERLKRQHRLICAAIHTGRLKDLKKMSGRDVEPTATVETSATDIEVETTTEAAPVTSEIEFDLNMTQEYQPQPIVEAEPVVDEDEESVVDEEPVAETEPEVSEPSKPAVGSYRISKQPEEEETVIPPPSVPAGLGQGLIVRLLDEVEFYAGETATVRVLVTNRNGETESPLASVTVSVKVLGTTFRPLIYSLKTQRNGIASVSTQIPQFNSGRAAVLIRATAKDQAAELRCIIHPKR